jgi:hypothetical protein
LSGVERTRVESFGHLEDGLRQAGDWYHWGPYLSERQWGTVREDYSADGEAWDSFPHDHARSRAYRWGEDGLAGFSDIEQRLCLGLALWNGRDPILKERLFGLTQAQANHGEDVKEYWWYLDAVPSHAWNRWRYHYPQAEFPYADLIAENGRRTRLDPEYELIDTGVFDDDRYWIVEVDYAKADAADLLMTVRVTNAGPEAATLHALPTVWFRNTWSWDVDAPRPNLAAVPGPDGAAEARLTIDHPFLGELELLAGPGPDGAAPQPLVCDNETNTARLYGTNPASPFPKDAINDHVVDGLDTVNPAGTGTKASLWYRLAVDPGQTVELRLRLRPAGTKPRKAARALGADFEQVGATRRSEADEFYAEMAPTDVTPDKARVMRQAFAGMLWSKQLYAYDVARWLAGDPTQPPPPAARRSGRNARWQHFESFDIMSMPDKWEYPWFAAWDLGFHCVTLAHVDPAFAKYQLLLLCREWFQHPNGALPAYEWDFGDVNPPVQAWAALEVFAIDGGRDLDFLSRVFDKLLVNFTWWVNLEDADGSNLFEGGFLGLDNIGPIDRSHLPVGGILQQSDATGWMAGYALAMASMASILNRSGTRPAADLVLKFLEHFAAIRAAMDDQDVWDEVDGFYCDTLTTPDGAVVALKVRSMVGIIPLLAAAVIDQSVVDRAQTVNKAFSRRIEGSDLFHGQPGQSHYLLSVVSEDHLRRLFAKLFDPAEFLSPYGLRALSAYHRDHPYRIEVEGFSASVDYEPAESTTAMFGGNSNWRGPIWFPLNYLLISALERYHQYFGPAFTVEYPTGSGNHLTLDQVASDLQQRLISLFVAPEGQRRPIFGTAAKLGDDPAWRDNLVFNEYFHGDTGAGLGASHQTGWTGLVADLIRGRPGGGVYALRDLPLLADQPTTEPDR